MYKLPSSTRTHNSKPPNIEIDIFRQPTTTDTTINFLSNHPIEQRLLHSVITLSNASPPNTKQEIKRMDINTTNRTK